MVKVEEQVQIASEELVNSVADEEASLAVRRYFTIAGRDPFDEIEWETRDAFIPGKDKPAFEQKGVEFPKFWSQTATNIVAQKFFRGRLSSPERERSVKQMIGRVVAGGEIPTLSTPTADRRDDAADHLPDGALALG